MKKKKNTYPLYGGETPVHVGYNTFLDAYHRENSIAPRDARYVHQFTAVIVAADPRFREEAEEDAA